MTTIAVPTSGATTYRRIAGWLALVSLGAAILVPALNGRHLPPLSSLLTESLAAAFVCAAALFAGIAERAMKCCVPIGSFALVLLAGYVALHPYLVERPYNEPAALMAFYVVLGLLALWSSAIVGRVVGRQQLFGVVAASLVVAGLSNAIAGVLQFYDLRSSPLAEIVMWAAQEGMASRAYGNVANANLLALTLLLGLVALGYLRNLQQLNTAVACSLAAVLLWALVLTASRWSILALVWIVAGSTVCDWRIARPWSRRLRSDAWGVAALFVGLSIFIDLGGLGPDQSLWWRLGSEVADVTNGSSGIRLYLWSQAIGMFLDSPWLGIGAGGFRATMFQNVLVFGAQAKSGLDSNAHNFALQLLAELGLVGLALVGVALGPMLWRLVGRKPRPRTMFALLAIGVVLIHSVLEFPLWYAHYLVLFAVLVGIDVPLRRVTSPLIVRPGIVVAVAVGIGLLVHLREESRELVVIERADRDRAPFNAWLHAQEAGGVFRTRGLLRHEKERLLWQRMKIGSLDPIFTLAQTDTVVRFLPAADIVAHRIVALWRLGHSVEALALADRMAVVFPTQSQALGWILAKGDLASDGDWQRVIAHLTRQTGMPFAQTLP